MNHAAVVVPVVASPSPAVLFIRRAAHLRRNAGQIAFPGGLVDPADGGDLRRTALREFEEELGVEAACVEIVGRLDDALAINRTVLITPFIGLIEALPALRVDPIEVAEALAIPLAHIVERGVLHRGVESLGRWLIPTWQLDWNGTHVWGATARILQSFLVEVGRNAPLRERLARSGVSFSESSGSATA